jgi:hypothetical protein
VFKVNRSPQQNSFQTMLLVMIAIYMLVMNTMNQNGIIPTFQYYVNQPDNVTHYNLRFVDVNGEHIDGMVYLDSPESWLAYAKQPEALRLVNKLGIAVFGGDLETAEKLHAELEEKYFSTIDSATYELVLRVVQPVEKYSIEGEPIVDQPIRFYQFQRNVATH